MFAAFYGCGSWHPKITTAVTSKITDHRNRHNNCEKLSNITKMTKVWQRDTMWVYAVEKMALIHLLIQGYTQLRFAKDAISAKQNKAMRNKTRYACIWNLVFIYTSQHEVIILINSLELCTALMKIIFPKMHWTLICVQSLKVLYIISIFIFVCILISVISLCITSCIDQFVNLHRVYFQGNIYF